MKEVIGLLVAILFLTGCVTTKPLPKPVDTISAIEFTHVLRASTTTGMDTVWGGIADTKGNFDGYNSLNAWWCPRHKAVNSVWDVRNQYRKFCAAHGGKYDRPFCRSSANPDDVLFTMSLIKSHKCAGNYPTAHVIIAEPTGSHFAPGYIEHLRKSDYKTIAEIEVGKRVEQDRVRKRHYAAREKEKQDAVLKKQMGTRVCKDVFSRTSNLTYVGYIEKVTDLKIQIRISDALIRGRQILRPDGFQSSVVWDYPLNWYVCESMFY